EGEQPHDHDGLRPSEPPWMCTFGRYSHQRRTFTPSELLPNDAKRTAHRPRHARNASDTASSLSATPCDTAGDPCDTAGDPCNAPETSRGVAPAIRRPCLRRAEILAWFVA